MIRSYASIHLTKIFNFQAATLNLRRGQVYAYVDIVFLTSSGRGTLFKFSLLIKCIRLK